METPTGEGFEGSSLLNPRLLVRHPKDSGGDLPTLSIVVTSYSYQRRLDIVDLLESIHEARDPPKIQVVLIMERDLALYRFVASLLQESELSFVVAFYEKLGGLSVARNCGARFSTAEFLAFLDDDVVLGPNWFTAFQRVITRSDWSALTGPSHPLWLDEPLEWFPRELSWIIGSTEWFPATTERVLRNAWGNNMLVRKDDFVHVGGFRASFGLQNVNRRSWSDPPSEDVDLSLRLVRFLRKPVRFIPELAVWHKVRWTKVTWKFIAQRSYTTGFQRQAIERFYPSEGQGDILSTEKKLMPQMLALVPKSIGLLFINPGVGIRTLAISVVALLFSALGYLRLVQSVPAHSSEPK